MTKDIYRDPSRPVPERVADLLGRMTLEEKAAQLSGIFPFLLVGADGRGDPAALAGQIPDGIGHLCMGGTLASEPGELARGINSIQEWLVAHTRLGIPAMVHNEALNGLVHDRATIFPTAIGLAATFQPELIQQMARIASREARAVGINHALSPVLDVSRDARWGRVHETYGEDPHLCAAMGVAFVRGMQTDDLREGTIAMGKHFLGYAYSEGALNQAVSPIGPRAAHEVHALPFEAAIRDAGLASVMNSYNEIDGEPLAGSRAMLTDLLRGRLGFDGAVVADYMSVGRLRDPHALVATEAEAGALALSAGLDIELPSAACYAHLPEAVRNGELDESLLDMAVTRALTQKFQVGIMDIPTVDPELAASTFAVPAAIDAARDATAASLTLLENDGILPLSATTSVAVIGPMATSLRGLFAAYTPPASAELLTAITLGMDGTMAGVDAEDDPSDAGATASDPVLDGMADILHGSTATIPYEELEDAVRQLYPEALTIAEAIATHAPASRATRGCDWTLVDVDEIPVAVQAAEAADVVVLALGEKTGWVGDATGGEGRDRQSLHLPGAQRQLVREVIATGKPAIAVVVSGRPLDIGDDLADAGAIIQAWYPGPHGGEAIADAIFGVRAPGGKLPVSFPASVGTVPTYHGHKHGSGASADGAYVDGPSEPRWGFGHGRSYTTFEFSDLAVSAERARPGDTVVVSCTVANSGARAGDEVVQLYIRDVVGSITRPVRQLAGFQRVHLQPGEAVRVEFELDTNQLAFLDADMDLVVEAGEIEVLVGSSSLDLPLRSTFEVVETGSLEHRTSFVTPVTVRAL